MSIYPRNISNDNIIHTGSNYRQVNFKKNGIRSLSFSNSLMSISFHMGGAKTNSIKYSTFTQYWLNKLHFDKLQKSKSICAIHSGLNAKSLMLSRTLFISQAAAWLVKMAHVSFQLRIILESIGSEGISWVLGCFSHSKVCQEFPSQWP